MRSGPVVVIGGAGFIGANLAERLLSQGENVRIFDNLSRPGVEGNLDWLRCRHGGRIEFRRQDVRDAKAVREAVRDASHVYHFAAQGAVWRSLCDPLFDFEVNAVGTLNVLEALRSLPDPPALYFASTNKVYGSLSHVFLEETETRYDVLGADMASGFSETTQLEFHTPYACSKGTADQYVLDYARSFGLRAVVFRLSSVYGPRQFGTGDQGWVAHFLKRSLAGDTVVIYGDGKQVRDVLFVDDLIDAFGVARRQMDDLSGRAFNLGGGPKNTLSLLELVELIGELTGVTPDIEFAPERPGDQRYYVSDMRRFHAMTGWAPRTDVRRGLRELHLWLSLPTERRRTHQPWAESATR
jgi:CDP-paratose 2-epimerase